MNLILKQISFTITVLRLGAPSDKCSESIVTSVFFEAIKVQVHVF